MTTITRWVLAHRRLVAAFWVVVTVVGIATVGIIGSAVAVGALVCGAKVSRGVKFRSDGSRLLEGLDLRRE